jgi:hypothetical protein
MSEALNLEYIPYDWIDEVSPDPRPSPDAWLSRMDDGAPCIKPDPDDCCEPFTIKDGQIVKFQASEKNPKKYTLTVKEDGSFTCNPRPPADRDWRCWLPGGFICGDIEEVAAFLLGEDDFDENEVRFVKFHTLAFRYDQATHSFQAQENGR